MTHENVIFIKEEWNFQQKCFFRTRDWYRVVKAEKKIILVALFDGNGGGNREGPQQIVGVVVRLHVRCDSSSIIANLVIFYINQCNENSLMLVQYNPI